MLKNILLNLIRFPLRSRRGGQGPADPETAEAVAALEAGNFNSAIDLCHAILARRPDSAQANHACGRAMVRAGRYPDAEPYLRTALRFAPGLAGAHSDLCEVLLKASDLDGAESSCRRAVELEPAEPEYRLQLADVLDAAGKDREALAELTIAQEFAPDRLDLLVKVCMRLERKNRHAEMRRIAERALMENGESFEAYNCLAVACHGVDDIPGAIEACRKGMAIRGDSPDLFSTLGSALIDQGKPDEAMVALRRALRLRQEFPPALFNMGILNLMRGKYREGWEQFDQRFLLPKNRSWRKCEQRWNGSSLKERTLLIMREQGLGDEIMYASCYADVIASAHQCFIECDQRLETLLKRSFPGATFMPLENISTREQSDPGVPVDVRSYAGSLPRFLRRSIRDFPSHQGYLKADPGRIEHWRARLSGLGGGLKVGLSWRGGTSVTKRGRRSFTLEDLTPLLKVPGVRWVNLQYGDRAEEIARFQSDHGISLTDWPEAIDASYDETAALVSALDLVISVCTSVVHLTGALGKAAWVMVPHVPEWRYGLAGERLPWYPGVRLFRQPSAEEWRPVLEEVQSRLLARVSGG